MENPRIRYVEWAGQRRRLIDLAREHGLLPSTVWHRRKKGWSLERALLTPARDGRPPKTVKWNGKDRTLIDLAREHGLPYETLYARINKRKLPLAAALNCKKRG